MVGDPKLAVFMASGAVIAALLALVVCVAFGDALTQSGVPRFDVTTPRGELIRGVPDYWQLSTLLQGRGESRAEFVDRAEGAGQDPQQSGGPSIDQGEYVLGLRNGGTLRVRPEAASTGGGPGGTFRYTYESKGIVQEGSARLELNGK